MAIAAALSADVSTQSWLEWATSPAIRAWNFARRHVYTIAVAGLTVFGANAVTTQDADARQRSPGASYSNSVRGPGYTSYNFRGNPAYYNSRIGGAYGNNRGYGPRGPQGQVIVPGPVYTGGAQYGFTRGYYRNYSGYYPGYYGHYNHGCGLEISIIPPGIYNSCAQPYYAQQPYQYNVRHAQPRMQANDGMTPPPDVQNANGLVKPRITPVEQAILDTKTKNEATVLEMQRKHTEVITGQQAQSKAQLDAIRQLSERLDILAKAALERQNQQPNQNQQQADNQGFLPSFMTKADGWGLNLLWYAGLGLAALLAAIALFRSKIANRHRKNNPTVAAEKATREQKIQERVNKYNNENGVDPNNPNQPPSDPANTPPAPPVPPASNNALPVQDVPPKEVNDFAASLLKPSPGSNDNNGGDNNGGNPPPSGPGFMPPPSNPAPAASQAAPSAFREDSHFSAYDFMRGLSPRQRREFMKEWMSASEEVASPKEEPKAFDPQAHAKLVADLVITHFEPRFTKIEEHVGLREKPVTLESIAGSIKALEEKVDARFADVNKELAKKTNKRVRKAAKRPARTPANQSSAPAAQQA